MREPLVTSIFVVLVFADVFSRTSMFTVAFPLPDEGETIHHASPPEILHAPAAVMVNVDFTPFEFTVKEVVETVKVSLRHQPSCSPFHDPK